MSMTNSKIEKSFDYLAEESKTKFQYSINSLLELGQFLKDKKSKAKNPDAIFFTAHEMKVIDDWIAHIATGLLTDYEIIHRTNKLTNTNYEFLQGLLVKRTPNIKDLLKA